MKQEVQLQRIPRNTHVRWVPGKAVSELHDQPTLRTGWFSLLPKKPYLLMLCPELDSTEE